LAFAPVYFGGGLLRPRFAFSPTVAIDTGIFSLYLFTRPSYCHYYFGDYFASTYDRIGIFPWFGVRAYGGYVYDPLFAYYRWDYSRRDPQWLAHLEGWHRYYRDHPDRRPPHDLAAQRQLLSRAGDRPDSKFLAIADPVQELRQKPDAPVTLVAVGPQEKAQIVQTARMLGEVKTQRAELESGAAIAPGTGAAKAAKKGAAAGALMAPLKAPLPRLPAGRPPEGAAPGVATRPEITPPAAAKPVPAAKPAPVIPEPKPAPAPKVTPVPKAAPRVMPREETPRVEKPRVETPRTETPRIETPRTERPRVETPRVAPPERSVPQRGRGPEEHNGANHKEAP
jgi:hypothetical protein